MDDPEELSITVTTSPASDSWGFVGVVSVGDEEAYRTIRAYTAPGDALLATQRLLADVLGTLMAGQEWNAAQGDFGHAPRRTELEFGIRPRSGHRTVEPGPRDEPSTA